MMDWYYGGAGWEMMLAMAVFWLAVVAGVIWAVARVFPDRRSNADEARRILDRRFASGELDVTAYRAAVHALDESVRRR